MFAHAITALMISSLMITQTPVPNPAPALPVQQMPAPPAQQIPASPVAATITVPAGTLIPLTLMSAVKSISTKPGDSVRAVVAFPVTVGSRLAIPAGTFVEGTISQTNVKPVGSHSAATALIQFTRLLFANGYSVTLNGVHTQSFLLPEENRTSTVELAELTPMPFPGGHFAVGAGDTTLPTLPREGPNPAVVGGAIAGGFAILTVGLLVWARHRVKNTDYVLLGVGLQFQMVLDSPVVLDATQVAAAASTPSVN